MTDKSCICQVTYRVMSTAKEGQTDNNSPLTECIQPSLKEQNSIGHAFRFDCQNVRHVLCRMYVLVVRWFATQGEKE